jgi:hypothetical protein
MRRLAIILLFAFAASAGCTSPEATRARGGGPGADVNNRPAQVKMHEGSRQYYETPVRIPSESPPLAPSEQARQLSLPGNQGQQPSTNGGEK